jgi:cation-transporting ATPase 13A1
MEFSSVDLMKRIAPGTILDILKNYDICATGAAVDKAMEAPYFVDVILPRLFVLARMSPTQKENVLASFKSAGYTTMMVGDGTNDVGALKQAHVGVALLDGTPEDLAKIAKAMRERQIREMKAKQEELMKRWGVQLPPEAAQQNPMNRMMEELDGMEEPPLLKLGDASVAAPFTSKLGTIQSSESTYYLQYCDRADSLSDHSSGKVYTCDNDPNVQNLGAQLPHHGVLLKRTVFGWNQIR